jgi:FdhD protein
MDSLSQLKLECPNFSAESIYAVLTALTEYNEMYKQAGAVHGCALCDGTDILRFVEDVGRHNAVDAISGWMWLNEVEGHDKVFYTTGRLTSEMVIKVAQMQVPLLLSRSGVTEMGLKLAQQIGIGMVARAKGRHFLVYNGLEAFQAETALR